MDAATNYDASSLPVSIHSGGPESDFNRSSISVNTSHDAQSTGEIVTRFELDVASICEKLTNLEFLSMHVETKENDFKAFVSDMDPDSVIKTLEYDLLSGYLDSEVKQLEAWIPDLVMEKDNVMVSLHARKRSGESLTGMVDTFHDSEKLLEQSVEQVLEIKARSANFEKNSLRLCRGEDHTESLNSNIDEEEVNEKMNLQTVELQSDALRMLDESLKREIDLGKRVSELTQSEETLTRRLRLLEQEVFYARGSVERESQLKRDLLKLEECFTEERATTEGMTKTIEDLRAQIIEAEDKCRELNDTNEKVVSLETELRDVIVKLQHAETCYAVSVDEKSMLLSTIKEMNDVIQDLKNKVTQGNIETDNMEDRCIFLLESNAYLKNELNLVKSKVSILETSLHQMKETKKASAESINLCSKFISDQVIQMTLEREWIQNQMYSLKQENNILVNRLKETNEDPALKDIDGDKASSNNNYFATEENKQALSNNFKVEKSCKETVGDIYARKLKTKDILLVVFILILPLFGVLLYQTQVKHS